MEMPTCFSTVGMIPVERAFETRLVQDRRVKRLRQAAHVVERRSARARRPRAGRPAAANPRAHVCPRAPAWHPSPSGSARTRRAVRGRCAAASIRGWRSASAQARWRCVESDASSCEQPAIRANQVEAREHDREQRCRQKPVDLSLHAVVDPCTRCAVCSSFSLFSMSSRATARAQGRLTRLQRQPDLHPRLGFLSVTCEREDPVDRVPELRERLAR